MVQYEVFAAEDVKDERLFAKILDGDYAGITLAFNVLNLFNAEKGENEGRCTYELEIIEEPAPGMVDANIYNVSDAILTNIFEDITNNYEDLA